MATPRLFIGQNPWLTPETKREKPKLNFAPRKRKSSPGRSKYLQSILEGNQPVHGIWDGAIQGLNKALAGWRLGQERQREQEDKDEAARRNAEIQSYIFGAPEGSDFGSLIRENPDIAGSENLDRYMKLWSFLNPPEKDREIIEGADGFKYYKDNKERVLPDVEKETKREMYKDALGYNRWSDTNERVNPDLKKDKEDKKPTTWTYNKDLGKMFRTNPKTGEPEYRDLPASGQKPPVDLTPPEKVELIGKVQKQIQAMPEFDIYKETKRTYDSVVGLIKDGATPADVMAVMYNFQGAIEPGSARVLESDIETMRNMRGTFNSMLQRVDTEFKEKGLISRESIISSTRLAHC